jgi:hypothetical protein
MGEARSRLLPASALARRQIAPDKLVVRTPANVAPLLKQDRRSGRLL